MKLRTHEQLRDTGAIGERSGDGDDPPRRRRAGRGALISPFGELESDRSRRQFAENIKHFRAERRIPRDDAARIIGISSKYLYMLEKGERAVPSLDVLKRIAQAYGRRIDDLDSSDPRPADEKLFPVVSLRFEITQSELDMITDDVEWAIREFEKIRARISRRLAEEKAARRKPGK